MTALLLVTLFLGSLAAVVNSTPTTDRSDMKELEEILRPAWAESDSDDSSVFSYPSYQAFSYGHDESGPLPDATPCESDYHLMVGELQEGLGVDSESGGIVGTAVELGGRTVQIGCTDLDGYRYQEQGVVGYRQQEYEETYNERKKESYTYTEYQDMGTEAVSVKEEFYERRHDNYSYQKYEVTGSEKREVVEEFYERRHNEFAYYKWVQTGVNETDEPIYGWIEIAGTCDILKQDCKLVYVDTTWTEDPTCQTASYYCRTATRKVTRTFPIYGWVAIQSICESTKSDCKRTLVSQTWTEDPSCSYLVDHYDWCRARTRTVYVTQNVYEWVKIPGTCHHWRADCERTLVSTTWNEDDSCTSGYYCRESTRVATRQIAIYGWKDIKGSCKENLWNCQKIAVHTTQVSNKIFVEVNRSVPEDLVYSAAARNAGITVNTGEYDSGIPTVTGGPVTKWTIDERLPRGLVFNTTTGRISGTPAAIVNPLGQQYAITAYGQNTDGKTASSSTVVWLRILSEDSETTYLRTSDLYTARTNTAWAYSTTFETVEKENIGDERGGCRAEISWKVAGYSWAGTGGKVSLYISDGQQGAYYDIGSGISAGLTLPGQTGSAEIELNGHYSKLGTVGLRQSSYRDNLRLDWLKIKLIGNEWNCVIEPEIEQEVDRIVSRQLASSIDASEFEEGLSTPMLTMLVVAGLALLVLTVGYLRQSRRRKQTAWAEGIQQVFEEFDQDADGTLSRDELDAWVRTRVDGEIQNILDEFDADRDGSISMDEFLTDGGGESTPSSDQESGKEDDTGPEGSSDAVDHSSMTVAQLKGLLREAGRPVSGKKAELIERLQE